MPSGSTAIVAAAILLFVGPARTISGVVVSMNPEGLGLALLGGGFVVVIVGSRVSTPKRSTGRNEQPSRSA